MKTNEAIVMTATVIGMTGLAVASFSRQSKEIILEENGGQEVCEDCGGTTNITYHHDPPEFWLKQEGFNSNDPKYGKMLCRKCHDIEDRLLLEIYQPTPTYSRRNNKRKLRRNR